MVSRDDWAGHLSDAASDALRTEPCGKPGRRTHVIVLNRRFDMTICRCRNHRPGIIGACAAAWIGVSTLSCYAHEAPEVDALPLGAFSGLTVTTSASGVVMVHGSPGLRPAAMADEPIRMPPIEPRVAARPPPPAPPPESSSVPAYSHIVMVMEENHSYSETIGSGTGAPYINDTLVAGGALLTNYFAISHPSQPNYYAAYAGSTFGIRDDNPHSEADPTLATLLQAASKAFVGYAENTSDTSGTLYAAKHAPWTSFPENLTVQQDFSSFPTITTGFAALPPVSFVVPNLQDDMHDGTVTQADTWLQNNIDAYAQWAKTNNSLLIVWFDEDDSGGDNQVPLILYGAHVVPGTYGTAYNHYNTLATICAAMSITPPRNAAGVSMFGVFTAAPALNRW